MNLQGEQVTTHMSQAGTIQWLSSYSGQAIHLEHSNARLLHRVRVGVDVEGPPSTKDMKRLSTDVAWLSP